MSLWEPLENLGLSNTDTADCHLLKLSSLFALLWKKSTISLQKRELDTYRKQSRLFTSVGLDGEWLLERGITSKEAWKYLPRIKSPSLHSAVLWDCRILNIQFKRIIPFLDFLYQLQHNATPDIQLSFSSTLYSPLARTFKCLHPIIKVRNSP